MKEERGQPEATVRSVSDIQTRLDLVGPHCAKRGMNCLGDTQDTSYQSTLNLFLDNNEVYAVAGTLGTRTHNATYTNLALYRSSTLSASVSISDGDLRDTAMSYVQRVNNADKFYLRYFSRDCSRFVPRLPGCLSVTEEMVPRGEAMKIIQRNYIKMGTARGPYSTQGLAPYVVTLDGDRM